MEYTLINIGHNTFNGMRCHKVDNNWIVDDVTDKNVIINYENCLLTHSELADEIHTLYSAGAKRVTMVKWVPEHTRLVGSKEVIIRRKISTR